MTLEMPQMEIPEAPTLTVRVRALLRDARDLARDHLELAALEATRAGAGFDRLVGAAIAISLLWVGVVALSPERSYGRPRRASHGQGRAVAAFLNVIAGAALALWMRKQEREVLFAATLRQLRRDVAAPAGEIS